MQNDKILEICKRSTAELYSVFDLLPGDVQPAILLAMVHIAREIEREVLEAQALSALDRPTPVVHNWAFEDILQLGEWMNQKLGVKLDDPGATVAVAIEQLQQLNAEVATLRSQNIAFAAKVGDLERQLEAANSRPVTLTVAATPAPSHNGHATKHDPTLQLDADTMRLLESIHGDEPELRQAAIELATGASTWRRQPATIQRGLALHLIPPITEGNPTILRYDTNKPDWMPTAQSIASLFGKRWSEVVDSAMRVMEAA